MTRDLAAFDIRLEAVEVGAPVGFDTGAKVRGLVYALVGESAPELAAQVHGGKGPKPYAASMLIGRHERDEGGEERLSAGPYRVRLCSLTGEMTDALAAALSRRQAAGEPIALGALRFRIRGVGTTEGEGAWGGMTRYAALAECAPRETWALQFVSPTAFRQRTGHLPLPVPACLFRSAWDRWNAFCPVGLRMGEGILAAAEESVFPSRVEIRTRRVRREAGVFVGFEGRVDLRTVRRVEREVARQLAALIEYVRFAGVGHGTTRGWGQVAVLGGREAGGAAGA